MLLTSCSCCAKRRWCSGYENLYQIFRTYTAYHNLVPALSLFSPSLKKLNLVSCRKEYLLITYLYFLLALLQTGPFRVMVSHLQPGYSCLQRHPFWNQIEKVLQVQWQWQLQEYQLGRQVSSQISYHLQKPEQQQEQTTMLPVAQRRIRWLLVQEQLLVEKLNKRM